MSLDSSKTVVLFDASKIDFAYVATADDGDLLELFNYKIGFYRLSFKEITLVFHENNVSEIELIVAWVLAIIFITFVLYCCVMKMI